MGRPSTYTPEIINAICERLSKGEPMAAICRDEGMPAPRTVRDWTASMPEVAAAIARAREDGFDALAEQCLDIAHNETHDWVMTQKGVITNETAVQRAKLQIDTHLKLLAKWDPKRYGEKLAVEATVNHSLADALQEARDRASKR